MRRTDWEGGTAAALALTINAMAIWALSVAIQPVRLPAPDDVVLQAVWVTRAPAPPSPPAADSGGPAASAQSVHRRRAPPPSALHDGATLPTPDAASPPEPVGARTLSAVYLAQARQQAQAAADPFSAPDPLADRAVHLPGKAAATFRMREPVSPSRAVAMVGLLFGGNDPKEPCRSNRARIADLGTAGHSERLQQELDFDRRWCRP